MWPFSARKASPPPATWAGSSSFADWSDENIAAISAAIRKRNGQPDSDGFNRIARITLNTMRGGSAVELVARAIHESYNPGSNADLPAPFSHYMGVSGMPAWCMWVEYARPAVEAIAGPKAAITSTDQHRKDEP